MKMLRILAILLCVLGLGVAAVRAQETADVQNKIEEYQRKITELQSQENSLSKQINLINSQIGLTTLRIASIKDGIDKLSTEIEELNDEIDRLEVLKTKRLELVLHRIPETYKRHRAPQFGIVLFSQNVMDFLTRVKYLSHVQAEDAELYKQLQNTQDTYGERKDLREDKKKQHESLKAQMEDQSRQLDRQKREKQVLLEQTKSSEIVYQQLLAQALAEKLALERALKEGIKLGEVKRGDVIGLVGNTGWHQNPNLSCSTGKHLHLEVRKNSSWVDPGGYLSSKTIRDEQYGTDVTLGSGNWSWPISDPIRLTQKFGHTPYSSIYTYSGGIHTGYDMVSTSSDLIRAPADGTSYRSSQLCKTGGNIINIVYIDHGDGVISFYLHVQ